MDSGACAEKPDTAHGLYSGQGILFDSGPSYSSGRESIRSASFKRRSRGELASRKFSGMLRFSARSAAIIRIDTIWLAIEPVEIRAGTEAALALVVAVFSAAKPHCAYLFANRRANRMKVLVYDGVGIWVAGRRMNLRKHLLAKGAARLWSRVRCRTTSTKFCTAACTRWKVSPRILFIQCCDRSDQTTPSH